MAVTSHKGKGKGAPRTTGEHFWATQARNVRGPRLLARKSEDTLLEEERELFAPTFEDNDALIDFSVYDEIPLKISGEKSENIHRVETFEQMWAHYGTIMPTAVATNVAWAGFVQPTPVQKFAIPAGLLCRDIMCVAQTGSGKTAAFLIPVIGRMEKRLTAPVGKCEIPYEGACKPDTVVITPTRELCEQIACEARKFCHRTGYIVGYAKGGNNDTREQLEMLSRGCDILVCVPGRAKHFLDIEVLDFSEVGGLVIDEADRMLDMGFMSDIREMVRTMPTKEDRQTMMFSATFPAQTQQDAQEFLYNHVFIHLDFVRQACDLVTQEFKKVDPYEKHTVLLELIADFIEMRENPRHTAIAFVNTKAQLVHLEDILWENGVRASTLSGDMRQVDRDIALWQLKQGEVDIMVATGVAERGLDVKNLRLVVNYDMPQFVDDYIHRVGRTGRAGRHGRAVSLITQDPDTGVTLENTNVLRAIVNSLARSKTSVIPAWLQPLIDHTDGKKGRVKGRPDDVRAGLPTRYVNAAHRRTPPVPSLVAAKQKGAQQAAAMQTAVALEYTAEELAQWEREVEGAATRAAAPERHVEGEASVADSVAHVQQQWSVDEAQQWSVDEAQQWSVDEAQQWLVEEAQQWSAEEAHHWLEEEAHHWLEEEAQQLSGEEAQQLLGEEVPQWLGDETEQCAGNEAQQRFWNDSAWTAAHDSARPDVATAAYAGGA